MKNDGISAEQYGGNKVRKLEFVLADAYLNNAEYIFTVGTAGNKFIILLIKIFKNFF